MLQRLSGASARWPFRRSDAQLTPELPAVLDDPALRVDAIRDRGLRR